MMKNTEKVETKYMLYFRELLEESWEMLVYKILEVMPFKKNNDLRDDENLSVKKLSTLISRPLIKGPFFEIRASRRTVEIIFGHDDDFIIDETKQKRLIESFNQLPDSLNNCVSRMVYSITYYSRYSPLMNFFDSLIKDKPDDWKFIYKTRDLRRFQDIEVREVYSSWNNKALLISQRFNAVKIEKKFKVDFRNDSVIDERLCMLEQFRRVERDFVLENV